MASFNLARRRVENFQAMQLPRKNEMTETMQTATLALHYPLKRVAEYLVVANGHLLCQHPPTNTWPSAPAHAAATLAAARGSSWSGG
jgi:hypothetical protein